MVVRSMSIELSQDELKEIIEKAIKSEEERFFVLVFEDITDYTATNWYTRHYEVVYGQIQKVVLEEQEEGRGNVFKTYIAIMPITREVVIRVKEDSDDLNWRQVYFYVFLANKGWVKVQ